MPVRQCIACGRRSDKPSLLRIVRTAHGLMLDLRQKTNGRSVYCCRSRACVQKLYELRLLDRFSNRPVPQTLYMALAKAIEPAQQSLPALIGLCIRAGHAALGFSAIIKQLNRHSVLMILIDASTGKTTRDRLSGLARKNKVSIFDMPSDMSLETVSGKANLKCIGITDDGLANQICQIMK